MRENYRKKRERTQHKHSSTSIEGVEGMDGVKANENIHYGFEHRLKWLSPQIVQYLREQGAISDTANVLHQLFCRVQFGPPAHDIIFYSSLKLTNAFVLSLSAVKTTEREQSFDNAALP